MAETKYFTVRGHKYKSIVYQVNMENDKRKRPELNQIEIKGKFPKPNNQEPKPGKSYLSQEELEALRREPSFTCFEQSGDFVIQEIPFRDLPEELQKNYDLDLYKKLKAEAK